MHDSSVQVQSGVKLGSFNYSQFKKKTIVMNVCKNNPLLCLLLLKCT